MSNKQELNKFKVMLKGVNYKFPRVKEGSSEWTSPTENQFSKKMEFSILLFSGGKSSEKNKFSEIMQTLLKAGLIAKNNLKPFRDNNLNENELYKSDEFVVTARSRRKVALFHKSEPLGDFDQVELEGTCDVHLTFYEWERAGQKGLGVGLNAVRFHELYVSDDPENYFKEAPTATPADYDLSDDDLPF